MALEQIMLVLVCYFVVGGRSPFKSLIFSATRGMVAPAYGARLDGDFPSLLVLSPLIVCSKAMVRRQGKSSRLRHGCAHSPDFDTRDSFALSLNPPRYLSGSHRVQRPDVRWSSRYHPPPPPSKQLFYSVRMALMCRDPQTFRSRHCRKKKKSRHQERYVAFFSCYLLVSCSARERYIALLLFQPFFLFGSFLSCLVLF